MGREREQGWEDGRDKKEQEGKRERGRKWSESKRERWEVGARRDGAGGNREDGERVSERGKGSEEKMELGVVGARGKRERGE
jgi:hypothetical protein